MSKLKDCVDNLLNNEKWMKIVRYLIVGGLTTLVSFVSFWVLCYQMSVEPNLANILSIACAIAFAYVTNKTFVFQSKKDSVIEVIKEAISFVLSRGITILLEIGGVFSMIAYLKWDAMLSKVIISVFVIILNYIISQFWVFKENKKT